jgi:hypothetical protein
MAGQANVRAGVLRRVDWLAGLVFFGRQGRQREEREDENQWDPKHFFHERTPVFPGP